MAYQFKMKRACSSVKIQGSPAFGPSGCRRYSHVYAESVRLLSYGRRVETPLNNRADALDFAIAYELNRRYCEKSGDLYVILSSAPAFKRLARQLNGRFGGKSGMVRSPMTSAVHQLLRLAGTQEQDAEDLAWRAVQKIGRYVEEIDHVLHGRVAREKRGRWDTPEDKLLKILGSVGSIQSEIEKAESRRATRIGRVEIPSDPAKRDALQQEVRLSLWKSLGRFARPELVQKYVQAPRASVRAAPVKKESLPAPPDEATPAIIEIMVDGKPIAHAYRYPDFMGCYGLSASPLEMFVAAFNRIHDQCYAKHIAEGFEKSPKETRGITVGVDSKWVSLGWSQVPRPLSGLALARRVSHSLENIHFVRLDTRWFDASFEEGICAIASHLKIFSQMAEFLRMIEYPTLDLSQLETEIENLYEMEPRYVRR